jgi:HK97 family phage major capsid protein
MAPNNQVLLQAVLIELESLRSKANPSADETARFNHLLEEGAGLKGAIMRDQSAASLASWAGESAGMLPLAGKATIESITPAGETVVSHRDHVTSLEEQYGEGIYGAPTLAATRTKEYAQAFRSYIRNKGEIASLKSGELKTLQEGSDTQGGFLVPEEISNQLIAKKPAPTRLAGRVTGLTTSRDALIIPRVNYATDDVYSSGMRVAWTGEVPASSTVHRVTEPVFGQSRIPIFTAMISMPLTNDMVEDSAFPVMSWSTGKFDETITLLRDNMILNGTGIGQPDGIMNNAGAGDTNRPAVVNSGSASALTGDGLIALAFALPEQYDDAACFVFNKTSAGKAIAILKDSNQRYLWGSGLQDSGLAAGWKNRQVLGYDVVMSAFMADVATNSYSVLFGDLRGFYMVDRVGFSVRVLSELYAETNQVLLLGRIRFGGQVAEPWRMKIGKTSA